MSEFCTVYGHEYYRLPCRGCRADELANGTAAPASRDATHAAHIRARLREPDPRERAAGMTREED